MTFYTLRKGQDTPIGDMVAQGWLDLPECQHQPLVQHRTLLDFHPDTHQGRGSGHSQVLLPGALK